MADQLGGRGVVPGSVDTMRLRLEPIKVEHAHDLWIIHNDDAVARWYGGTKPTLQEAVERAEAMSYSWETFGVHKWMAYDRETGELIGRGGPSPTPADDDWGRVRAFLPDEAWAREERRGDHDEKIPRELGGDRLGAPAPVLGAGLRNRDRSGRHRLLLRLTCHARRRLVHGP